MTPIFSLDGKLTVRRRLATFLGAFVLLLSSEVRAADESSPWKTNVPIVTVKKELYLRHKQPREARMSGVMYVGPKLELREVQGEEVLSDVADNLRARWSRDNGRTWTPFSSLQKSNNIKYGDVIVWEGEGNCVYDPATGLLVSGWLRQIMIGNVYHCFMYSRYSRDVGKTWSSPRPLRYEEGADFDPKNPTDPKFLNHNEGYFGNNLLIRKDGSIVQVLACSNAPGDPKNNTRPWRLGSIVFTARWNARKMDYDWTPGARVEISPDHSARGLLEPEVAELNDRRLLVVWRGSTEASDGTVTKIPGYKFYSLSTDGGRTLTAPAPWKYDDGSHFYSSSSYHRMIRHRVTGKLYWLGNINPQPPRGNLPRYPLLIAEVDEKTGSLRKSSVTLIDDRQPNESPHLQLSNFALLEDRETHALELRLTTYGQEPNAADWATADCYKYFLKVK